VRVRIPPAPFYTRYRGYSCEGPIYCGCGSSVREEPLSFPPKTAEDFGRVITHCLWTKSSALWSAVQMPFGMKSDLLVYRLLLTHRVTWFSREVKSRQRWGSNTREPTNRIESLLPEDWCSQPRSMEGRPLMSALLVHLGQVPANNRARRIVRSRCIMAEDRVLGAAIVSCTVCQ
jgi:hypothetical protein